MAAAGDSHKVRATAQAAQASAEHLDSFASAAGLMQLSSAAMAADAAASNAGGGSNFSNNSRANASGSNAAAVCASPADASLPPGWQRIIHGSGLPCYVHDGLGVVCWTRPYPLDVGGDGALSQPELHRLVKQHVPPLSIFAPGSDAAARRRKESLGAAEVGAAAASPALPVLSSQESSSLSIKTPAQVLQEYQNRNRGVSINYNTVPVEGDGVKLFKTIVTAGSTVAEGVASTKKIAKQLGAQQLLAMLHERTARKYFEVAEMYNNSLKGQPVISESSTFGPATPLRNDPRGGNRGSVDPRLQRTGSNVSNRMRRVRRPSPNQEYDVGGGYREYEHANAPAQWGGYNQQPMQHMPQQAGSQQWAGEGQQGAVGMDNIGPERVVVYSTSPPGNAPGGYGGGQYYNNNAGGNAWGAYPNANQPESYPQHYVGVYGEGQPPPGSRQYGYGNYQLRSSDRPSTSTPIERVTVRSIRICFGAYVTCDDRCEQQGSNGVFLIRTGKFTQPDVEHDNAGLCPNRFAVHALEVKRNEQAGAFVAASKREKTYCFAAASSKMMIKWANAIHNWRRHAFDDPVLSVHDDANNTSTATSDVKRRASLLESQRQSLENLASRFDVKLVTCNANTEKKPRRLFKSSSLCVPALKDPIEMKISRPSFAVISWLPGRLSALRPSLPGR
ncbi:unnamed protein product [Phytophthora fragariaefolia]|uniref:Unnamed protein product n=1 Tax=Phytophthora fragariaefolia TaxID=1490495 RepID=A0A9W7CY82_9STRA|nr:unnamed protein product [Phytophthora fragariaefolia]